MTAPSSSPFVLRAAWVAPMCGPVLCDAAVAFAAGSILGVGSWAALRAAFPGAEVHDAGNAVVVPGLVNAHTHLELSDATAGGKPAGFVPWLLDVMGRAAPGPAGAPGRVARAVAEGVAQCLRFGVTTVGDISRECRLTRRSLRGGPLRVVSYGEVTAMAARRGFLEERLAAAADTRAAGAHVSIGVSPHAPYSIEPQGYRRCLEVARAAGLPLTTHLAESADEAPFLAEHRGSFWELWARLGAWDEAVPRFAGGPIRLAEALGLLDYPATLLAHVNYCDDAELAILAAGKASVALCPRTHAFFGHPPHRWREMLAAGVNVAVGTDSCASAPDLNLVDDLRLLYRQAPEVPPQTLWEMATARAARAVGLGAVAGTLEPGKAADLAVFPAAGEPRGEPPGEPLRSILETDVVPLEVWVRGVRGKPESRNQNDESNGKPE